MVCASCGDKFLQVLKMTNDNYMASFLSPDKNPVVACHANSFTLTAAQSPLQRSRVCFCDVKFSGIEVDDLRLEAP